MSDDRYSRLPQETVDRAWAMHDAGETNVYAIAQAIGRSYSTTTKLIQSGRRFGVGAPQERIWAALNEIDGLIKEGAVLEDALSKVGMGMQLYTHLKGCGERKAPKASVRPKAVKAESFSGEWWEQNNDSFIEAMRRYHPEKETPLRTVR